MQSIEDQATLKKMRAAMIEAASIKYESFEISLAKLLAICRTTLGVNRVSVWTFERGRQRLRLRHVSDDGHIHGQIPNVIERAGHERYFAALVHEFAIDASQARTDLRTSELAAAYLVPSGIHSMLDVPLRTLGEQIGVLCVEQLQAREWHLFEQSFTHGVSVQVALMMERDELASANSALVNRVLFDRLTRLPNFMYADDQLKQNLGELERQQCPGVAVIHADIEQFLLTANSLGQAIAQELLVLLGRRLSELCAAAQVFLARSGDDDFMMLLRSAASEQAVEALCRSIIQAMSVPFQLETREVICSLALGYSLRLPGEGDLNADSMFREAWTASRAARRSGQPRRFERSLLVQTALEVELEQLLRKALRDDAFEPHFQPIIDLRLGKVVAFEALMRWRHEQRVLTPVEFMAVAQRSGLIVPIGKQLLERTMREFVKIRQANAASWTLNVNLSPPEFLREGLVADLSAMLKSHQLLGEHLALEITESVVIEDMPRAKQVMETLQQLGITVHLDDLGTGYSSLNYLRALPVDGVKLDYAFTHDVERNVRSQALIKALSGVAATLKQSIIAEGVEWNGQLLHLRQAGIELIQGFLFAKATPSNEITPLWVAQIEALIATTLAEQSLSGEAS